jgi:hypothetical protein
VPSGHGRSIPKIAVVAGMPRGGTTMLHHVFDGHPGVYSPFRKETSYFSFQYDRGPEWYASLYRHRRPGQLGFDISGNYILLEETIQRILDHDPDMKVVISVRDPAAVVVSLFRLMYNWDPRTPPLETFIEEYHYRFGRHRRTFEFAGGLLTRNLAKFREALGDNLLLIDFRLYRQDLLGAVTAIEEFVGMEPHFSADNLDNRQINSSSRRNLPLVSRILSSDAVSAATYRFYPETSRYFPDRLARRARKRFDRMRIRPAQAESTPRITDEQRELARRTFARETELVDSLFADHPILLGSGRPYRPPAH